MWHESRQRMLYSWAERDISRIGGKPLLCRYWGRIKAPEINFLFIALTFMRLCTHSRSRGNNLGVDWINLPRPSLITFLQVTHQHRLPFFMQMPLNQTDVLQPCCVLLDNDSFLGAFNKRYECLHITWNRNDTILPKTENLFDQLNTNSFNNYT